ncbi:hypothetical protein JW935_10140 [candidate division KSB1 bacterium]|nr:hypothetical protein [candidate division KSB1 bacterium]
MSLHTTAGPINPFKITEFDLSIGSSTDIKNIEKVKLYYQGSDFPAEKLLFAETNISPDGSIKLLSDFYLPDPLTTFLITFDTSPVAISGSPLQVVCHHITVNGIKKDVAELGTGPVYITTFDADPGLTYQNTKEGSIAVVQNQYYDFTGSYTIEAWAAIDNGGTGNGNIVSNHQNWGGLRRGVALEYNYDNGIHALFGNKASFLLAFPGPG